VCQVFRGCDFTGVEFSVFIDFSMSFATVLLVMAKSQDKNTSLTRVSPLKPAKGISDVTKSRIANVAILETHIE